MVFRNRTLLLVGLTSLLTDVSSEMVYPLLPFLVTVHLGASKSVLGLSEGVAESIAQLTRVFSGMWSDRAGRRKPLALAGCALAASGELRQGSNMGGGQMVTADYVLTPAVVFSENNAGGVGGAVGSLFGTGGRVTGALAGGLQFKEAQTSMLLADARSSLQVAAAEGSAQKADFRLGGLLAGAGTAGALGGYANTNEGKVVAASFADNYNGIVRSVRGNPGLQRNVASLTDEAGTQPLGLSDLRIGVNTTMLPQLLNGDLDVLVGRLQGPDDLSEQLVTRRVADLRPASRRLRRGSVSRRRARGRSAVRARHAAAQASRGSNR